MSLSRSFSSSFILVLLVTISFASSRIIGISHLDHVSHNVVLLKLARELKHRGHEYTHVLPKGFNTNLPLHGIDVLTYQTNITAKEYDQTLPGPFMKIRGLFDPKAADIYSLAKYFYSLIFKQLLGDEEFIAKVKGLKPDLLLCDSTFHGCAILSDLLQVPRVDISTCGLIDVMFSYHYSSPQQFLYLTPPMIQRENRFSFLSRLTRSFVFTSFRLFTNKYVDHTELWRKHVGDNTKHASYQDLIRSVGIVLVTDDFALEETRPLHPNVKVIGPISASPAKPLPDDLERFMQKCKDGVILVSLGTVTYPFREDFVQTLADGLAAFSYTVIWKLSASQHPKRIGENTHIMSWMPQNDLLAHNATKLFITQGGMNSFLESVYHRVPMVVIPLVFDQHTHGAIASLRKIGIRLDKFELTASDIPRAVEDIMTDKQYQKNINRISKLMTDRPRRPEQEGADWIEYALRHDGALHLSPDEVPLYQQCMLDVLAAFVGLVVIVVSCILLVFKIIFTLVRNRMKMKKE